MTPGPYWFDQFMLAATAAVVEGPHSTSRRTSLACRARNDGALSRSSCASLIGTFDQRADSRE